MRRFKSLRTAGMRQRNSFISGLMIAIAVLPLMNILQLHRAEAQGIYYWGQTYGTRSILLGGTVIGSVSDVSATYYNPGALGLIKNPEIILTAKINEYNRNELSLDGYEEATMASNKVSASPRFFAGSLGLDSADIHKIFFSIKEFMINFDLIKWFNCNERFIGYCSGK